MLVWTQMDDDGWEPRGSKVWRAGVVTADHTFEARIARVRDGGPHDAGHLYVAQVIVPDGTPGGAEIQTIAATFTLYAAKQDIVMWVKKHCPAPIVTVVEATQ